MGTYMAWELLAKWQGGRLTVEQLAGQLLQMVVDLETRVAELERKEVGRNGNSAR